MPAAVDISPRFLRTSFHLIWLLVLQVETRPVEYLALRLKNYLLRIRDSVQI